MGYSVLAVQGIIDTWHSWVQLPRHSGTYTQKKATWYQRPCFSKGTQAFVANFSTTLDIDVSFYKLSNDLPIILNCLTSRDANVAKRFKQYADVYGQAPNRRTVQWAELDWLATELTTRIFYLWEAVGKNKELPEINLTILLIQSIFCPNKTFLDRHVLEHVLT